MFIKKILNKIIDKETSIKKNPFGNFPLASKEYYLAIFEKASSKIFYEIDQFEKKQSFNIDKNWIDNLALHTQIVKKNLRLITNMVGFYMRFYPLIQKILKIKMKT